MRSRLASQLGGCPAALVLLAVLQGSASAIVIDSHPTMEQRVRDAEIIAVGVVGAHEWVRARPDTASRGMTPSIHVYTRYAFVIEDAWKGSISPGDTMSFLIAGGALSSTSSETVEDQPHVFPGQRLLVFLSTGTRGMWKGERVIHNTFRDLHVEDGRIVRGLSNGRKLSSIRREVLKLVRAEQARTR